MTHKIVFIRIDQIYISSVEWWACVEFYSNKKVITQASVATETVLSIYMFCNFLFKNDNT